MPFAIHKSPTEKKRLLIQAVVEATRARSPGLLKEWVDFCREITSAQMKKPESKRVDGYGYLRVSVPRELFFTLRRFIKNFGDDDADIKLLAKELPDMVYHKDKDLDVDRGPKTGWKRKVFPNA